MTTYRMALILAFALAAPQAARADRVTPPSVPTDIAAPAGARAFLVAHAVGTQSYLCSPKGAAFEWAPSGPQATLFNEEVKQVLTHYLSPNPYQSFGPFATWQHSRDSSAIWGRMLKASTDPAFVAADAIPWLLLEVVGAQYGPDYGDKLVPTTYIQRVNTVGGKAPATGCAAAGDLFKRVWIPYESDYYFYK